MLMLANGQLVQHLRSSAWRCSRSAIALTIDHRWGYFFWMSSLSAELGAFAGECGLFHVGWAADRQHRLPSPRRPRWRPRITPRIWPAAHVSSVSGMLLPFRDPSGFLDLVDSDHADAARRSGSCRPAGSSVDSRSAPRSIEARRRSGSRSGTLPGEQRPLTDRERLRAVRRRTRQPEVPLLPDCQRSEAARSLRNLNGLERGRRIRSGALDALQQLAALKHPLGPAPPDVSRSADA